MNRIYQKKRRASDAGNNTGRYDELSYRTVVVNFPASESDLQEKMRQIDVGITTEKLCLIDSVQSDNEGLQALVETQVNHDEVQYLAKRMDRFDKNELNTFYAAASHGKLTELKDLTNLTFNLHCYALISDLADISAVCYTYKFTKMIDIIERKNII